MTESIGAAAANIRKSNDTAQESIAVLQAAIGKLEEARGELQAAADGTPQADATEALGVYNMAFNAIREAQRAVSGAIQSAAGVADRL